MIICVNLLKKDFKFYNKMRKNMSIFSWHIYLVHLLLIFPITRIDPYDISLLVAISNEQRGTEL